MWWLKKKRKEKYADICFFSFDSRLLPRCGDAAERPALIGRFQLSAVFKLPSWCASSCHRSSCFFVYIGSVFPSSKTSPLVVGPRRSALQPTIKTQQPTKWRKMKNLAVQCESCVEYLRGRVSSAPPRSLRALSGEIRPRSKCSVCKMCFL